MRESNEAGIRFVLTDLGLAETFLSISRTTHHPQIAKRNQKNARTAYDAIARILPKLCPTTEQSQTITDQMNALRLSLESLGEAF